MLLTLRSHLAAHIVAIVLLVCANPVPAQMTESIEGANATVELASGLVYALGDLDVERCAVGTTWLHSGTVNFPVNGGAVDFDAATCQILHSGVFTPTARQTLVTSHRFIVDITAFPAISRHVSDGGKLLGHMHKFDLALPSAVSLPRKPHNGLLILRDVGVTLHDTQLVLTTTSSMSQYSREDSRPGS